MKGWMGAGLVAGVAAGFLLAGSLNLSFAQAGGEDVVSQRTALMKEIAAANKIAVALAKGGDVAPDTAAAAAKRVRGNIEKAVGLFPAGTSSDDLKTRARPEIWANMDQFKAAANRLASAAGDLEKAAAAGDSSGMRSAAAAMGQACGACHKQFRGPAVN